MPDLRAPRDDLLAFSQSGKSRALAVLALGWCYRSPDQGEAPVAAASARTPRPRLALNAGIQNPPNAKRPAKSLINGAKMSPFFKARPSDALKASWPRPRNTPPWIFPIR